MMTSSDAAVAAHIASLDRYRVEGVDFETIGKIVVASVVSRSRNERQVDDQGHRVLEARLSMRLKIDPDGAICCVCEIEEEAGTHPDIIICRGPCCD
jgi:hypothetical protein